MGGRIRTIKPEWLEDERLADASSDARVLSVALLLLADDYGNGRGNARHIGARVFPNDPATADRAIAELEEIRFVQRYVVDDQTYFHVRNWAKHQRVDKPGRPLVPGPKEPGARELAPKTPSESNIRESLAKAPETLANLPGSLAPDRDLDHDQDQDQEIDPTPAPTPPPPTPAPPEARVPPAPRAVADDGLDELDRAIADLGRTTAARPAPTFDLTPPPAPKPKARQRVTEPAGPAAPAERRKSGPSPRERLYVASWEKGVATVTGRPMAYRAEWPIVQDLIAIARAHLPGLAGDDVLDGLERLAGEYAKACDGSQFHPGLMPKGALRWLNDGRRSPTREPTKPQGGGIQPGDHLNHARAEAPGIQRLGQERS